MWRTLIVPLLAYGCGHPGLDGYRPALLDRPLQSFYGDVNAKILATLDDALYIRNFKTSMRRLKTAD